MEQVENMSSSPVWLRIHGLKQSKLTLSQIIMQISFRHSEDYVRSLRRSVSSQYAEGLFSQFSKDGSDYNLTATPQQLQELCYRLEEKVKLYRHRMDWLTTGSRQLFGVIQEHSVAMVLDFGEVARPQYQLSIDALCTVIREQVSQISKINLFRSGASVEAWREMAVTTSEDNLKSAEEWLLGLAQEQSSQVNTTNALLKAMEDTTIESVYLFSVGDFQENVTDVLRNRLVGKMCPIHTVSFNANDERTKLALKDLSHLTAGRFHAFAERHSNSDVSLHAEGQRGGVGPPVSLKQPIGDVLPGGGVREDVYLVWWEMEEALRNRDVLQDIQRQISPPQHSDSTCPAVCVSDECLSSRAWLSRFGLNSQRLAIYDALADCAFRHSDGIVDIKCKPMDETTQSDAGTRRRLVNAKYCEGFAHMKWSDGSLVHVYVTAGKCQWYEERMRTVVKTMKKRLEWLRSGSREMFGTVLEDQVYFLIDTSESMRDQLPHLKDKIYQLIQEQLCHKAKINFVEFGSRVGLWRNRLTETNAGSLESAWWWVKRLQAGGSTNTLGALAQAFTDHDTQAVYLLTDGRPDQPIRTIMEQVRHWGSIPVHTISFNCDDEEANSFLYELARETQGRFHCYHPNTQDPSLLWPYESEEIHLLKSEIEKGEKDLESVRRLRAECVMLDVFHHGDKNITNRERPCQGPHSAPILQSGTQCLQGPERPKSLQGSPVRPSLKQCQSNSLRHAGNTKASLLRLLTSDVTAYDKDPILNEKPPSHNWMLSETQALLQMNTEKQNHVLQKLGLTPSDENQKRQTKRKPDESLNVSSAQWLRTNSLVARRLTILDALASTAISHSPKQIPLLKKQVYSKVFDEVLPLFHISSGSTQRLTLVNPIAVNLEGYKAKLQKALCSYERRLNGIVWRVLTQDERDKFGGEPVAFKDYRDPLLQALERLGWPVDQEDVDLLEDQIQMGLSFLQQASNLQQAAKQSASNTHTDSKSKTESTSSETQRKSLRKPLDTLRGQRVIARSEADGCYYNGTVRKRLNGRRVMIDFSSGDSEIIPQGSILTVGGAQPCPPLTVGDFVLVVIAGDRFVPGVVIATPRRLEAADKLFSILKYNNEKVHCQRCKMMKISQTRYSLTCLDLKRRHLLEQPIPQQAKRQLRRGHVSQSDARPARTKTNKNREDMTLEGDQDHPTYTADTVDDQVQRSGTKCQVSQLRFPSSAPCRSLELHLGAKDHPGNTEPSHSSEPLVTPDPSDQCDPKESSLSATEREDRLVQRLMKALEHHRGVQVEEIQSCVKALSGLKERSLKSPKDTNSNEQQREERSQHLLILEQLQRLLPLTSYYGKEASDVPEYVNTVRLHSPKLRPGQEVIGRSSHDGWYYNCSVVHACGDHSYFLQGQTGELERICREDIFTEEDDSKQDVKIGDPVIGVHPLYLERYCPGVVLKILEDKKIMVRYYEETEGQVSRSQLFLISSQKFYNDVTFALECEECWVGQPVIARCDQTATYRLAEVKQRVGNGGQLLIRWADNTSVVQNRDWIFGRWSRSHALTVGDYVLTMADSTSHTFLPGVVHGISGAQMEVHFISGQNCQHLDISHCFWLSEDQFHTAMHMYTCKQQGGILEAE